GVILAEITSANGEDILYIDQIASVGAIYGDDVESSLRTALQNNLHCMSAVTNSDYEANNNEEENLLAYFRSVKVDDKTEDVSDADDSAYEFVGDKVSPDLRDMLQRESAKKRINVILQADDINDSELRGLLSRNGVTVNES